VVLVSDENVAKLHAGRAAASLQTAGYLVRTAVLPPGETHKTYAAVARLWEAFLAAGIERGSTVVALGGGVVSDLAGFAAAVFLRGVRWAVVPTSLLAMADASLGGKPGADLPQGKNLIGAFHPPSLVLADPALLASLPEAELRSGLAEVVKHGILSDPALFAACAEGWQRLHSGGFNLAAWDEIVRRAMAVKIRFIEADPYERGQRAALNLGHTVGHALEQVTHYQTRHGEAVSIGMVAESRLAEQIGLAERGLAGEIAAVLRGLGLPVEVPAGVSRESLLEAMRVDKKRASGKVRFALPVRIGEVRWGVTVDPDQILS
jgi:3-dehydroquinate synthase